MWSHKPGGQIPTNLDGDGKTIPCPLNANRLDWDGPESPLPANHYTLDCGMFCAPDRPAKAEGSSA